MKFILSALITFATLVCSVSLAAEEYPKVKLSALLMLDHDTFDKEFLEDANDGESHNKIRRARLGISTAFTENWAAKLKVEFTDETEIKDGYIKYSGWDWASLTLGKQKEPFGLEKLMSSRNTFMIEKSMMTDSIAPGRTLGANFSGKFRISNELNKLNWQLGYFQDDNGEKSNAVTGRIAWAPWKQNNQLVHLGFSFSDRSLHSDSYRINQTLEVHTADSNLEGKRFDAKSSTLFGAEFIWQYKSLTTMAEWQTTEVEAESGKDYQYEGGYYQMSYLFGGKRKYKNGLLGGISTKNTWEATMRYSQLNLKEENDKGTTLTAGLNYIYNKDLKFMANYIHAQREDNGDNLNSGNALALRIQYNF